MFGIGLPELGIMFFLFFGFFLLFIINVKLAKRRGKSVALILLSTFIFSWIVTLILAFLPEFKRA